MGWVIKNKDAQYITRKRQGREGEWLLDQDKGVISNLCINGNVMFIYLIEILQGFNSLVVLQVELSKKLVGLGRRNELEEGLRWASCLT